VGLLWIDDAGEVMPGKSWQVKAKNEAQLILPTLKSCKFIAK
jgi:hypothetical protein